jgi:hypothetical protein
MVVAVIAELRDLVLRMIAMLRHRPVAEGGPGGPRRPQSPQSPRRPGLRKTTTFFFVAFVLFVISCGIANTEAGPVRRVLTLPEG